MASSSRPTSIRRVLRKSQHGRKPSRPDVEEDADNVTVTIHKDPEHGFGISVAGGDAGPNKLPLPIIVSHIKPGSPAERADRLKVGMRIISINGQKIEGCNHPTAVNLIRSSRDDLTLTLNEGLIDWSIAGEFPCISFASTALPPFSLEEAQPPRCPETLTRAPFALVCCSFFWPPPLPSPSALPPPFCPSSPILSRSAGRAERCDIRHTANTFGDCAAH
jgi:hypothetical protein